jgi:tetratricopeptide (TPR) repeat protein
MKYSALLGLTAALVCWADVAQSASPQAVEAIAKQVTVKIKLQKNAAAGSGTIVHRQGDLYTLVTNRHVVCGSAGGLCNQLPAGEAYTLRTVDGQSHRVTGSNVKLLGKNLDLAIVQFRSSRSYQVATMADRENLKTDDWVYTAGFPAAQQDLTFGAGQTIAVVNKRLVGDRGGYTIIYNATTLPGMSGGGLFDSAGKLVAIHGYGDRIRENTQLAETLDNGINNSLPETGDKIGYNRGIPIRWLFKGLIEQGILPKGSGSLGSAETAEQAATTADEFFIIGFNKFVEPEANSADGVKAGKREALRLFDRAIQINPKYTSAYYARAVIHNQLQEYELAIANYDRALALNPNLYTGYFNRALLKEQRRGDLPAALADYDRAIALNPEYAGAYNNRGVVKLKLNDVRGALADYNKALALNPKNAVAFLNRALLKENYLKDFPGAMADYDRALQLDPNYGYAYLGRASLKSEQGNYAGALADYNRTIELLPNFAIAYYNRGLLKEQQMKDERGALADYDRAIALDSKFARAYGSRAKLRQSQKDIRGALQDYDRAIALAPKDGELYLFRGLLKGGNLSDFRGAVADYDRAIALLGDKPSALLALAYLVRGSSKGDGLGDRAGGIADVRQAVKLARAGGYSSVLELAIDLLKSWQVSE